MKQNHRHQNLFKGDRNFHQQPHQQECNMRIPYKIWKLPSSSSLEFSRKNGGGDGAIDPVGGGGGGTGRGANVDIQRTMISSNAFNIISNNIQQQRYYEQFLSDQRIYYEFDIENIQRNYLCNRIFENPSRRSIVHHHYHHHLMENYYFLPFYSPVLSLWNYYREFHSFIIEQNNNRRYWMKLYNQKQQHQQQQHQQQLQQKQQKEEQYHHHQQQQQQQHQQQKQQQQKYRNNIGKNYRSRPKSSYYHQKKNHRNNNYYYCHQRIANCSSKKLLAVDEDFIMRIKHERLYRERKIKISRKIALESMKTSEKRRLRKCSQSFDNSNYGNRIRKIIFLI